LKRAVLYVCYYHITEPLVQTQVVAYLRELARRDFEIHLLTFERNRLEVGQRGHLRDELNREGIRWHTLRYHRRPTLLATTFDIVRGSLKVLGLCAKNNIALVHGRSHVGAAMALAAKRLRGVRMLFDVRGLLADEYADGGHWMSGGIKYRLTKAMERMLFRRADGVVVLTDALKAELTTSERQLQGRGSEIEVIPCCVDPDRFAQSVHERRTARTRRGWDGRLVLIYLGKLGSAYLVDEMARFVAVAREEDPRFFLQVLTQSDPGVMRRALASAGLPQESYEIGFAPPAEVPGVLAAADAGISFRVPGKGSLGVSPAKVAEYLAAGLAVASTSWIGDSGETFGVARLGVLIDRLDETAYRRAAQELIALLNDPTTPQRCREFAARKLSLSGIGGPRYAAIYERLLAGPSKAPVSELSRSETTVARWRHG
jgi:glycosyltransferase involved in cell wall biosynthesis